MSDVQFVYITAGSMDEAGTIGSALISKRLAACVNILENMHSLYWWEGKVQEDREVVLIAKTTKNLTAALTREVKKLHSYDCPCVLALPVESGNPEFLAWIRQECS